MIYTKEQAQKIIEEIKQHIDDQGSCRVGWACQKILGEKQQNHVHDKIAGLIIQQGQYLKDRNALFPQDWNIIKNPDYKRKTIKDRYPIGYDVFLVLLGAVAGFIASKLAGH